MCFLHSYYSDVMNINFYVYSSEYDDDQDDSDVSQDELGDRDDRKDNEDHSEKQREEMPSDIEQHCESVTVAKTGDTLKHCLITEKCEVELN